MEEVDPAEEEHDPFGDLTIQKDILPSQIFTTPYSNRSSQNQSPSSQNLKKLTFKLTAVDHKTHEAGQAEARSKELVI